MRLILFYLFFLSFVIFGQSKKDFQFVSERHFFNVIDIDHYISEHTVEGVNLQNKEDLVAFAIRDNCSLETLNLFYLENGKKKKVKLDKSLISSTVSYGSFFNGQKTYFVPVEGHTHFSIEYTVKELNTIFISRIDSSGYYDSDKVEYSLHIPPDLQLTSQQFDRTDKKDFLFTKEDFTKDSPTYFFLIVPKGKNENDFFSDWMEERIDRLNTIKPENIPVSLIELAKKGNKLELAKACFNFIQKDIRYLDIENGVNAIVPRPCNFVLENKYGDCKDMANTLVSLLKYFGFEAYNCISRTNQKEGFLDFPSVAKANHMICGFKMNEKWIFLDATEENCRFGEPSLQILGTEAFAIGNKGNYFLKVPDAPNVLAKINVEYFLNVKNQKISVDLSLIGKTNTMLFDQRNNPEIFDRITSNLFSYSLPLVRHSITDTLSALHFEGALPKAFVTELSTKQIVQTNFLAEMKSLILLASYTCFPLYPFSVESKIKVENVEEKELQAQMDLWTKTENNLKMVQNWTAFKTQAEFEESVAWLQYKSKSVKPILIQP